MLQLYAAASVGRSLLYTRAEAERFCRLLAVNLTDDGQLARRKRRYPVKPIADETRQADAQAKARIKRS